MPKNWTSDLVGLMHSHKITQNQLAKKLGVTFQYVSMIMNGHRSPPGVEQRFRSAVDELVKERKDKENE